MKEIAMVRKKGILTEVVFLKKGEKIGKRIFQNEFQAFCFAKVFMKTQQKLANV